MTTITRDAKFTNGGACQYSLTEVDTDSVYFALLDAAGKELVTIVTDRRQFALDALALLHRAGVDADSGTNPVTGAMLL